MVDHLRRAEENIPKARLLAARILADFGRRTMRHTNWKHTCVLRMETADGRRSKHGWLISGSSSPEVVHPSAGQCPFRHYLVIEVCRSWDDSIEAQFSHAETRATRLWARKFSRSGATRGSRSGPKPALAMVCGNLMTVPLVGRNEVVIREIVLTPGDQTAGSVT